MTVILDVDGVTAGFGSTTVLHGLSYQVQRGEIAGIFGLNGAGKSVSMKVLAGIIPAWSGRVTFDGIDITTMPAEARVHRGIGHVPQGRQVFPALTVEQNLRLGAYPLRRRSRARYAPVLDGVLDRFPLLRDRLRQPAGTMSGGEQAALAVARAMMSEPALLLVDEPSAGLAPIVVSELFATLRDVARSGVTMVLVEQNVTFGLQLADRAHILQTGRIVYSGAVAELDQASVAEFLGVGRLLSQGVERTVRARKPAKRTTTTTTRRPRKAAAKDAPTKDPT